MNYKRRLRRTLALGLLLSAIGTLPCHAAQTQLKLYNSSNNSVLVYITLGAYSIGNYPGGNPGFIQDVQGMNFSPPTTISGSGLQGSFTLPGGSSVTYNPPAGQAISGNFSFGTPPNTCPVPQFPNGQNLAEFTLNTNTPAYNIAGSLPQEALDISCVNGVNSLIQFNMVNGSSGQWKAGNNVVTTFKNGAFGQKPNSPQNQNKIGVYSVGCDECNADVNPGGCPSDGNTYWQGWSPGTPPLLNLCNVQRPGSQTGGLVTITFQKFYPIPAVKEAIKF